MGSRALALSLPFSCILGFLSSVIAFTIGIFHAISFFADHLFPVYLFKDFVQECLKDKVGWIIFSLFLLVNLCL